MNYEYDNKLIRVDKIIVDSNMSNNGFKEVASCINNLTGQLDFEGKIEGINKFTGSTGIVRIEATMLTDEKLILNNGLLNLEIFNIEDGNVTIYEIEEKINSDVDIVDLAKVAKYYNLKSEEQKWNRYHDFNKDNIIDLYDIVYIARQLGELDDDNDGLSNSLERELGTNRYNPDSDDDNIIDGVEINLKTNPLDNDTDDDKLTDGFEYYLTYTNPLNKNSDNNKSFLQRRKGNPRLYQS
ncbi:MAG: hypothetical protein ACRC7N_00680 [Clostridium sp.]